MSTYTNSVDGPLYGADGSETVKVLLLLVPVRFESVEDCVKVSLFEFLRMPMLPPALTVKLTLFFREFVVVELL